MWTKVSDNLAAATSSLDPFNYIPQVDGIDDTDFDDNELTVSEISPQEQCHPLFEKTPYFLIRENKSEKVCKDATKDDMEVKLNNSNTNINT